MRPGLGCDRISVAEEGPHRELHWACTPTSRQSGQLRDCLIPEIVPLHQEKLSSNQSTATHTPETLNSLDDPNWRGLPRAELHGCCVALLRFRLGVDSTTGILFSFFLIMGPYFRGGRKPNSQRVGKIKFRPWDCISVGVLGHWAFVFHISLEGSRTAESRINPFI